MTERNFSIRALGEVAIRCVDYAAMTAFYRDVIGLDPLNDPETGPIAFLRVGEGFQGHTAIVALFRHDIEAAGRTRGSTAPPATGPGSSLHHIALTLPWNEQDAVIAWYEHLGRDYNIEYFDWVGWRGVFTFDPDGNTVELVAKDPGWTGPSDTPPKHARADPDPKRRSEHRATHDAPLSCGLAKPASPASDACPPDSTSAQFKKLAA